MHSLYWRIFRSFWLAIALILAGTVIVAVSASIQRRDEVPWVQRGDLFGQADDAFQSWRPGCTARVAREPRARPGVLTHLCGRPERS